MLADWARATGPPNTNRPSTAAIVPLRFPIIPNPDANQREFRHIRIMLATRAPIRPYINKPVGRNRRMKQDLALGRRHFLGAAAAFAGSTAFAGSARADDTAPFSGIYPLSWTRFDPD